MSIMSGKDFPIIPIREICTEAFSSAQLSQRRFFSYLYD